MYGIPGNDPFSQFGLGQQDDTGDRLVDRIMAAEYSLSIQQNDGSQALGILARMLGQWLNRRLGG
jgi:hypothetical protein